MLLARAEPPINTPLNLRRHQLRKARSSQTSSENETRLHARYGAVTDVIQMLHGSVQRALSTSNVTACFTLRGDFDIYDKQQLASVLAAGIGYHTLTIDLAQTTFIDASIIGVLARLAGLRRDVRAARLRIVNANVGIRRLFSICWAGPKSSALWHISPSQNAAAQQQGQRYQTTGPS